MGFKRSNNKYFLLAIFYLIAIRSFAEYRLRHLTTKEGLPSKSVQAIIKDSAGFMWFGTYDGLFRYDGYSFQQIQVYDNHNERVTFAPIYSLCIDKKNTLWVGSVSGVARFNKQTGKFQIVEDSLMYSNRCYDLTADNYGNVWIGTPKGLIRYSYQTKTFGSVVTNYSIRKILVDQGVLYLATNSDGVLVFDTQKERIIRKIDAQHYSNIGINHRQFRGLWKHKSANIWFATDNGGLYEYNFLSDSIARHFVFVDKQMVTASYNALAFDCYDQLWLGTLNEGLLVYNTQTNQATQIRNSTQSDYALTSDCVSKFYTDNEGIVWIGTQLGGVCYYNLADRWVDYFYPSPKSGGLPHNIISCFEEIDAKTVLVGTDGGGLCLYDKTAGSFLQLKDLLGLKKNAITDIKRVGNLVYISQWEGGVSIYKLNSGVKSRLQFIKNIKVSDLNYAKGVFIDRSRRVWLFPSSDTLQVIDTNGNDLPVTQALQKLCGSLHEYQQLTGAVEQSDGTIWFYGFEGICRVDRRGTVVKFNNKQKSLFRLPTNRVHAMACDNNEHVWAATADGLLKYNSKTNRFEIVHHPILNKVFSLVLDKEGRIWFTSTEGFGCFDPDVDTVAPQIFDRNVGIIGYEFIERSAKLLSDGTVLLGSANGFVAFDSKQLRKPLGVPRPRIIELTIFNKKVQANDSFAIITRPIEETDTIVLKHEQSVISFTVSSLKFISAEKCRYAYFLEGFDDKWNDIQTERKIYYTNLNPGTYSLWIKASNSEQVFSKPYKQLTIVVLPPWWKTWWFQVLGCLFVLAVFLTIYLTRVLMLKRRNALLNAKVHERTQMLVEVNEELQALNDEIQKQYITLQEHEHEIEFKNLHLQQSNEEIQAQKEELESKNLQLAELVRMKDKFFSIIAHDLKNPLNALIGFSDLLLANEDYSKEKRQKFTKLINESANHLYALLVNLLDWARSQTNSVQLSFEPIAISTVIAETIELLAEQAMSKNVSIINMVDQTVMVDVDKVTISTAFRNLVSNAIKFTASGGTIIVSIQVETTMVIVCVSDNGVGMTEAQLSKIFMIDSHNTTLGTANEKGTGLGLILCKEFIEKNGGKIWVKSELNKGSDFYFSIPKAMP